MSQAMNNVADILDQIYFDKKWITIFQSNRNYVFLLDIKTYDRRFKSLLLRDINFNSINYIDRTPVISDNVKEQ